MTRLIISIHKIIKIEFAQYLLVIVNIVEDNKISRIKNKNIKLNKNEIVKILDKLKKLNLVKSRSENLSNFKKSAKYQYLQKKPNFISFNTRFSLTILRKAFNKVLIL